MTLSRVINRYAHTRINSVVNSNEPSSGLAAATSTVVCRMIDILHGRRRDARLTNGSPTLERCAMHRLASVHLHSCSHHCPRLSVTIVTDTGQRATSRRSLVAFTEEQVCGKIFLRNFTFACRKCRRCGSSRLRRWGGQRNGRARKLWQFDAAHPTYYGFLKETGGQNSPAWLLSASGLAAGLCPSGTPHRLGKGTDRDRP